MKRRIARAGFTLVEVLVATVLSTLLVLGLISVFLQHRQSFKAMQLMTEMDQNLNAAIDAISRDLRMAHNGMLIRRVDYAAWTSPFGGMISAVTVVQGASGAADQLTIVGVMDSAGGTLANSVEQNAYQIQLAVPASGVFKFNTSTKRLIMIGKAQTARITSTASGGTILNVSTEATTSRGLTKPCPAGAPVELIKKIDYSIKKPTSYPGRPYLLRADSATTVSEEWHNMVACGIEDMQISVATSGIYRISLTARSAQPDKGTNYLRRTVQFTASQRMRDFNRY